LFNLSVKPLRLERRSKEKQGLALPYFAAEGEHIVELVKQRFYTRTNGKRAKGWKSHVYKIGDRKGILRIWNNEPFAVIERGYVINMGDKYLAIPQEPALKEDGTKKYPKGPGGYKMFDKGGRLELKPVKSRAGVRLLMRVNKKHEIVDKRAWWRLEESVHVRPTTPGLTKFVKDRMREAGASTIAYLRRV